MGEDKFIDVILKDLSELKFDKIYKMLFTILGFVLPVLPLIFLYKQNIWKQFEIIGTLIITLVINSMLILMNAAIFAFVKFKTDIKKIKEIGNKIDNDLKSFKDNVEKIERKVKDIKKKSKVKLTDIEIESMKKEIKEFDEKIKQIDKEEMLIKKESELAKESLSDKMDYGIKIAILINIIIGFLVVITRVMNMFLVRGIKSFKDVIVYLLIMYVVLDVYFMYFIKKEKI